MSTPTVDCSSLQKTTFNRLINAQTWTHNRYTIQSRLSVVLSLLQSFVIFIGRTLVHIKI